MCCCIVGLLWYVAGIGDAIIYRERMQEGSDAVAFSAAVLHARGMNLIVLLNLVMALVLAIRVAMKVIQVLLVVVGAVLCCIPWTAALGVTCFNVANSVQNLINNSRDAIDNTLKGIATAQRGIAKVVPPAAIVGSYQVGDKYKPLVETSAAAGKSLTGLPVEDGSPDMLCEKAGQAMVEMISWVVPIPGAVLSPMSNMFGKVVRAGGAFFCEIGGSGGGVPDFSSDLEQGGAEGCAQEKQRLAEVAQQAATAYQSACTSYGANCQGDTPTGPTLTEAETGELSSLAADRDKEAKAFNDFDVNKCIEDSKGDSKKKFQENQDKMPKSSGGSGQKIVPQKVKEGWQNGCKDAQLLALSMGNRQLLNDAPPRVKLGAWKSNVNITTPESSRFDLAQSEFFFDCGGSWGGDDCNGPRGDDAEAMWRFHWRARLRRFNGPFTPGMQQMMEGLAGIDAVRQVLPQVARANSFSAQNAIIASELARAVEDGVIIH
jgi:hypothetical protein